MCARPGWATPLLVSKFELLVRRAYDFQGRSRVDQGESISSAALHTHTVRIATHTGFQKRRAGPKALENRKPDHSLAQTPARKVSD